MQAQKNTPLTTAQASAADKLRVALFRFIPHHAYASLLYQFCQIRIRWIKNLQISLFVRIFKIDTRNAVKQRPKEYSTLNAFFTRAITPESRPMPSDPALIVSPSDSKVMELGKIVEGRIAQVKGIDYSLKELLGADDSQCDSFKDGAFINLYLSPKDYHRVHSPIDALVHQLNHIPGLAYPVSEWSARSIKNLYSRNERAVIFMQTPAGPIAMVMVAALGVSSIETSWEGRLAPPRATESTTFLYTPPVAVPTFNRGEEMGRFNLGSSIVLLFGSPNLSFLSHIEPGASVQMGTPLAKVVI